MVKRKTNSKIAPWRENLYKVIFEAETPSGKLFDVLLLWAIILSVFVVLIESVGDIRQFHGESLRKMEWGFTLLFSVEYVLRLICTRKPFRYVWSFYGIVDLLAVLPTYLSFFMVGTQSFLVIRGLRFLRIFRIFKLARFVSEAKTLTRALRASRVKIAIFLGTVLTLTLVLGTLMYLIEGEANGFTSIPRSIYWAIVTMTTVGYGDITPHTFFGQVLASAMMILGYSIIAIPTGIVSVELAQASKLQVSTKTCPHCTREGHDFEALFCKYCGKKL